MYTRNETIYLKASYYYYYYKCNIYLNTTYSYGMFSDFITCFEFPESILFLNYFIMSKLNNAFFL